MIGWAETVDNVKSIGFCRQKRTGPKRDTMRLRRDTVVVVALHKKIEVIFTGLGFSSIARMQWYL